MVRILPRSLAARWVLFLAAVLGLVGVTIVVGGMIFARRAHASLEEELAALRARGEPVLPEDLLAECAAGDPETMDWLLGFMELPETWRDEDLSGDSELGYETALEMVRAEGNPEDLALLESWRECLKGEPEAARLLDWTESERFLDLQPTPEEITPCELVALRVWMETSGACYERALQGAERGPVDTLGELERMLERRPGEVPELYPRDSPGVVDTLSGAAVLAALEGRVDEALRLLELVFHLAGLMEGQTWSFGYIGHSNGVSSAEKALEQTLPYLPADADFSDIETFLVELNPRDELRVALRGERAFVNRIFQLLREGELSEAELGGGGSRGMLPGLALGLLLDLNQQKYLELMERILQECEKPEFDPARAIDRLLEEQLPPRWDRIIAGMLLPKASALHELVLEDEVRRQFALAALQARREGVEVARAEIARRIDPFSGEPFRTRVEANGTLVMWSAGQDGIDDEARWNAEEEEYEDLIWRFRPAQ